jgi:hypothetical protein
VSLFSQQPLAPVTGRACPNGVWNHTRGCGCVPHRPATAEVPDIDLTSSETLGEWGLPQVGVDGTCDNCGHYQEPFKPCEVCNPTCPECGCETADGSKCDECQDKDDEAWADYDETEDEGW